MENRHQNPDAGTSASAVSQSVPVKQRLPPIAITRIDEYFQDVTDRPTKQQRLELLAEIHALSGCYWLTEKQLETKFIAKRAKAKKEKASLSVRNTLYPSLKPETLEKLQALFQHDPDPTPKTVEIWASRLGARCDDVQTWVSISQEKRKQQQHAGREDSIRLPHLPTPEHTASPEPTHSLNANSSLAEHLQMGLATSIHNTLSSHIPPPPESLPTSLNEFVKCFELHERGALSFLQRIRDGNYEVLGLTASDIPPLR